MPVSASRARTVLLVVLALLAPTGWLGWAGATALAHDIARLWRVHLNIDADRDGVVERTERDDPGDDLWQYGSGAKGAIVLANADDDDCDHLPDNADERVNAFPDERDLAPLVLRVTSPGAFPPGARLVLRVARPTADAPYDAAVVAKERLRIFMPTRHVEDELVVQAGDQAVIGPAAGERVEFVAAPQPPQRDIALLAGQSAVRFGMEGIRYNSLVDIILEIWLGPLKLSSDRVQVRAAPFILLDNSQRVSRDATTPSVYVEDLGEQNAALRVGLREVYGATQVAETRALDRWLQDGFEVGYSRAPYGAMWVVLGLSRGQVAYRKNYYGAVEEVLTLPGQTARFDPHTMRSLNELTRQHLLGEGVGLITTFEDVGSPDADAGGNLEAIPGRPGRFLYGSQMNAALVRFLEAQGVQQGVPIDTSLLAVGHVDELFSYCPDGVHVLVVAPDVAWALLLIAARLDPQAEMLQGMVPDPSRLETVGELVAGAPGDLANIRAYNLGVLMAPDRLPALLGNLGIGSATSRPVAAPTNHGVARLTRAGGLVGFMPNSRVRTFKLTIEDAQHFNLSYQEAGTEGWAADGAGEVGQDFVSPSHTAFVLREGWAGGRPEAGDAFTFTVDPTVPWVQIPMLYYESYDLMGASLTNNHVNALVDGDTLITAQAHGPLVDLGAGKVDILADYVARELRRAGYREVIWVDDRAGYHNHGGSMHCATNVFREIPITPWWE